MLSIIFKITTFLIIMISQTVTLTIGSAIIAALLNMSRFANKEKAMKIYGYKKDGSIVGLTVGEALKLITKKMIIIKKYNYKPLKQEKRYEMYA